MRRPRPQAYLPTNQPTNGASETTVNVSLADLLAGTYAINVHKSPTEASIYTACGDRVNMQLGGGTVGMPSTGSGDQTFIVLGLIALATTLTGTGLRFARRKV
ncbi:MAG: LPXTG cell wall anchor domain-containing protein [Chloroflexia bacterium]